MYGSGGGYRPRGGRGPAQPAPRNPPYRPQPASLDRVEAAVATAQRDLLAAGEHVSAWKLAHSAALSLRVDSWGALGFKYYDVPSLRAVQSIEAKINAFIHCFVGVRKMTSVHELETELCRSEGVEKYEELGLGPLLRQPLVHHYFSVPADAEEVCKITVEELVSRLNTFLYKKHKDIAVEEFLDYLVQKHSAASREALGVRIQSLGLYIKFIKGARRSESIGLKSIEESGLLKKEQEKPPEVFLDHLNSFASWFEDGNDDAPSSSSAQGRKLKKGKKDSCTNTAAVDEMKHLGLKLAMFNDLGNGETPGEEGVKSYQVIETVPEKAKKLKLEDEDVNRFVRTWKGACRKHSVAEALAVMLHTHIASDKRKRKMQRLFLSYPAVGLLNVAVRFIKSGEVGCTFKDRNEQESQHMELVDAPAVELDTERHDDKIIEETKNSEPKLSRVSVEDIIGQISKYLELDHHVPGQRDLALEKQLVLRDCEIWVKTKFSVKDFKFLGHGTFFEFLEKFAFQFPNELNHLFTGGGKSSLVVSILHQQLLVLLSQAAKNLGGNNNLTRQFVSFILKKQFPILSFQIMGSDREEAFLSLTKSQENCDSFCSVLFSAALFGSRCSKNLKSQIEKFIEPEDSKMAEETDQLTSTYGPVAAKDAIECLLKAPMLSDLKSWSHWDLIFAPSLGPLLHWLLNVGSIKELLCIVTSEGRIIRIDQSASPGEFFEAIIQGLSLKAAVKLLSLFCLSGGSNNFPLSLLKCHAQSAIDIVIKKFMDHLEADTARKILAIRSSLDGQCMIDNVDSVSVSSGYLINAADSKEDSKVGEDLHRVSKAYSAVSIFILDCLGQLPSEFRSFAADVLFSGLRSFTKDAATIILSECNQISERIMLHDIGLSLGIVEWINDYNAFSSDTTVDLFMHSGALSRSSEHCWPGFGMYTGDREIVSKNVTISDDEKRQASFEGDSKVLDWQENSLGAVNERDHECLGRNHECSSKHVDDSLASTSSIDVETLDATLLIESIRHEEFGLDSNLKDAENILLKKQHARLGRALQCLSQELYSNDSHFLLELVQNADDNRYPEGVEPTMVFILQHNGIVVLNNEKGFSAENIRALCDVGSSTKKGSSAGYIGKKGIGFKSVFRVTDAPEIHSNGFHVKFDISDGQIGFVLPTVIPPCDIKLYQKQLSCDFDRTDVTSWNTCIVLPFKPKQKRGMGMTSIISMFSDLHPSLLLFLHRLQCIKFKNMIDGKLVVMRRTNLKDGIVMVSRGKEKMSWLVVSQNLQASTIRPEIQTTKISIAFPLQESDEGHYNVHLDQQPAFAFLPLRKYGLKFILQGDFVLPSSREEIDEDNAWNQWLLLEFPSLFVSAENSFCALPCFQESPAKAVTAYMSFIPLLGEVYGFFSQLPRMIISKLRTSNCLLLDGPKVEWVPPCRVLRGWNGEAHTFLSESLLQQHLGLGFLNKDIILPDSLARALGIREYGPKFLVEILSSMHQVNGNLKAMTLDWLSSWLNALYTSLSVHSSGYLRSENIDTEADIINNLREIPFIPLSDGLYSSVAEGAIWLPCDASNFSFDSNNGLKRFPYLYAKLRTVTPLLFSTSKTGNTSEETIVGNLIRILRKIGVQQLSAHEVIRNHILPSFSNGSSVIEDSTLMIEYLSFVMIHLQSACPNCETERSSIISNLQMKSILLTNHGYKCPIEVPIHFGKAFGNAIDVKKLFGDNGITWHEIDVSYLKHPSILSLSFGLTKWREFFQELGVSDFVHIIHSEKNMADLPYSGLTTTELFVQDWESPELVHLLTTVSSSRDLEKSRYLLEVLDNIWDDYFSPKLKSYTVQQNEEYKRPFESSLVKSIKNINWIASSISKELHYPQELFYDCESVRSILGDFAPYAVPKVSSKKFLEDIGFKVQVALDDALKVMQLWRNFQNPRASISQMSKFYSFVWDELATSLGKISEVRSNLSIFIPWAYTSKFLDVVPGKFMSVHEVYWHDPTGCMGHMRETILQHVSTVETKIPSCVTLAAFYPGLHDFFVNECRVLEVPPFGKYLEILLQLSSAASPSEAADEVFQVLLKWADDLKSGQVKFEEMVDLKEGLLKLENTVLPTTQGKWVSLHPSFGLVCWSDDEELMEQCMHLDDVYFLEFGELTVTEKEMLSGKVAALLRNIGIPALSEVISREAIFYGRAYTAEKALLVNWILPYAQRYLYKLHPDTYFQLKQSAFKKISELQVIEVDRLYYKNTLKGHHIANSKRIECSCLLQGNILYADQSAESHSLFLELSRFFLHGVPELHMANFLHMLTIKAELEYTNEQLESFIINSQKLPEIPDGERTWSLSSLTTLNDNSIYAPISASPLTFKRQYPNLLKNPVNQSSWPPRNMTRAPDFQPSFVQSEARSVPVEIHGNFQIEDDPRTMVLTSKEAEIMKDGQQATASCSNTEKETTSGLEPSVNFSVPEPRLICTSKLNEWDTIFLETPEEDQLQETGRLGETIAFKYFTEKLDSSTVEWVNEESETGLPYDLITGKGANKEYIEVKATRSTSKDWFPMSVNEWHCAAEKGDSYSIARVVISSATNAKVLVLKNPLKLCQENVLQLAILGPYSTEKSAA